VVKILFYVFTVFSLLISPTTQNIERAFLENNPKLLFETFSTESHINISLPEPITFSDQLSNHQAFFLFKKIFSTYSTFEFYSERQRSEPDNNSFIFKARWSFRDKKNNNQYVYHIYFHLLKDENPVNETSSEIWRITEIRAEKI
jgi:hypothetical protein